MISQLAKSLLPKKQAGIYLGKIEGKFFNKEELLSEAQLNHHVHIVGASGFGKTVLLKHIFKDRIRKDRGLLFIDLKGDRETIDELIEEVEQNNRKKDLRIFSLDSKYQSSTYNVLQHGTATQLRDTLMVSLSWSEEFYRNQSSSFLLKVLIGLCHLRDKYNEPLTIETVLNSVSRTEFLKGVASRISNESLKEKKLIEECFNNLKDKAFFDSLQGLRSQLESLVLSEFGEKIKWSSDPKINCSSHEIDLFKAINENQIVFVTLDSRRYAESSKVIGKFILQDLKATSARIDSEIPKEKRNPFTVIIDEFADLAQEDFIGFLDRARSSKIGIVVAHQEICDLLRISSEFAGRLMGNTSTLYSFLQKRPESAEMISGIAGTRKAWKETLKTEKVLWFDLPSGEKSLREVEEFNIHPNIIKSLEVGRCICVKKYPKAMAYKLIVSN